MYSLSTLDKPETGQVSGLGEGSGAGPCFSLTHSQVPLFGGSHFLFSASLLTAAKMPAAVSVLTSWYHSDSQSNEWSSEALDVPT